MLICVIQQKGKSLLMLHQGSSHRLQSISGMTFHVHSNGGKQKR